MWAGPSPRPYPHHGMTTSSWPLVPVRIVPISMIHTTQGGLSIDAIWRALHGKEASWDGDRYPHLVEYKEKYYLEDGHNRLVAALIRGDREIMARVKHVRDRSGYDEVSH